MADITQIKLPGSETVYAVKDSLAARTTDLANYLPLTGGTLTGNLISTGTFTSSGSTESSAGMYINAGAGSIYLVSEKETTGNKYIASQNASGTSNAFLIIDQSNNVTLIGHSTNDLPLSGGTLTGNIYINTTTGGNEAQLMLTSGAGSIYLFDTASTTGSKGLIVSNASGTYSNVIVVDQNNSAAFYGTASSSNRLAQYSSTSSTDEGGLYWGNVNGKMGTTVEAYDTPSSSDTWWYILRNKHTNTANDFYTDLAIPFSADGLYYKRINDGSIIHSSNGKNGWIEVLDSLNYYKYAFTNCRSIGSTSQGAYDFNNYFVESNSGISLFGYGGYISNHPSDWVDGSNHYGMLLGWNQQSSTYSTGYAFQLLIDKSTQIIYSRMRTESSGTAWSRILDSTYSFTIGAASAKNFASTKSLSWTVADILNNGTASNASTALNNGIYAYNSSTTNTPISSTYGVLFNIVSTTNTWNQSNNWIWQLGFTTYDDTVYVRKAVNSGSWSDWRHVGTKVGYGTSLPTDTNGYKIGDVFMIPV